jgi:hypothetical protein
MLAASEGKRKLIARIGLAFIVPWFVMLAAIWMGVPLLTESALPLSTRAGLMRAADCLITMSIIVLPLAVWLHARLCWHGSCSLRAQLSIGPAIAALAALIFQIADDHNPQPTFFLDEVLLPGLLVVIVASAVGCIASWSAWHFVTRTLHASSDEIARRFD